MKQLESREVTVGENIFYIRPFPAFKAAKLSGELAALVLPLATSLTSLIPAGTAAGKTGSGLFDIDVKDVGPAIGAAFSALSGDKIETVLKHLLISGKNVSVEVPGERVQILTEDLANELFCEDVQDMFILAFEVIRTNYNGFFAKLGGRFGPVVESLKRTVTPSQASTESSTSAASAN